MIAIGLAHSLYHECGDRDWSKQCVHAKPCHCVTHFKLFLATELHFIHDLVANQSSSKLCPVLSTCVDKFIQTIGDKHLLGLSLL